MYEGEDTGESRWIVRDVAKGLCHGKNGVTNIDGATCSCQADFRSTRRQVLGYNFFGGNEIPEGIDLKSEQLGDPLGRQIQ